MFPTYDNILTDFDQGIECMQFLIWDSQVIPVSCQYSNSMLFPPLSPRSGEIKVE